MTHQKIPPGPQDPAFWGWAAAPGVEVTLGGRCLVMPPMNAQSITQHWPAIWALMQSGVKDEAAFALTTQLVFECLRRNYPGIPAEWVTEYVDWDNWEELNTAIFGQGPFRQLLATLAARAAADPGNAPAPQPQAAAGTGAPSTPASPPPPAGPSGTSTS